MQTPQQNLEAHQGRHKIWCRFDKQWM